MNTANMQALFMLKICNNNNYHFYYIRIFSLHYIQYFCCCFLLQSQGNISKRGEKNGNSKWMELRQYFMVWYGIEP